MYAYGSELLAIDANGRRSPLQCESLFLVALFHPGKKTRLVTPWSEEDFDALTVPIVFVALLIGRCNQCDYQQNDSL